MAVDQYLGDLAASLGFPVTFLVGFGAVLVLIILALLRVIFAPKEKELSGGEPEPEGVPEEELPPEEDLEELMAPIEEEEDTGDDLETVMHFSPEKVKFEADVNNLTIRLVNPAPKVVEKVVEIPVEKVVERRVEVPVEGEKGPRIREPLDVSQAQDLPSGMEMLSRKYGLASAVLLRADGSLLAPESDEARAAAEKAASIASSIGLDGREVERAEIAGREKRYLLGTLHQDSLVLAALSSAEGIDEVTLNSLSGDLKSLLGAHLG